MILQPGLTGNWQDDKAILRTIEARAKLGIPPTLYLPTTNLEAKCAAIKAIDQRTGCGFAIHLNFGSKWWAGNNSKTGAMKSPLGNDAAWMEETSQLNATLATIAKTMWPEQWISVADLVAGVKRLGPVLRAIILEDEWRVNANDPKKLYTDNASPDMLAAVARRWSQRIASLSILGPCHDLICYGRGYNEAWTFQEEHGGNRLDVGRNVYRVAEYLAQKPPAVDLAGYLNYQCKYLKSSSEREFFRKAVRYPTTAWLTLGLGYDATGKWYDDGPELYPARVSGEVGRVLRGNVDNVVLYRVASEAHLRAFVRAFAGPATRKTLRSSR